MEIASRGVEPAIRFTGLHRDAADDPQHYASVSLDGSAFIYISLGAAHRVTDRLRVGATVIQTDYLAPSSSSGLHIM